MVKRINTQRSLKSWFQKLMSGYAWACNDTRLIVVFLLLYLLFIILIGWHTNQALCYFAGTQHLCGIPYLAVAFLGILTLIHEAEYNWQHKWAKVPIGILSVCFIYYCMTDSLWMVIESVFGMTADVSAWGSLLSAAASAVSVAVGYWNTRHIQTVTYRIFRGDAEPKLRIVLISDIHLGAFVGVEHVRRIIEAVNAIQPDLVVIAGDLIDDDNSILSEPDKLRQISLEFCRLCSKYGTVLALGNHDPDAADPAFLTFLEESHIRLLHNQVLELPDVNVVGVSDPTHNERISVATLLAEKFLAKPVVVVDHDPRYMDTAVAQDVDLVLSGHTHAGQFFPASVLTRIALGRRKFYGYHKVGNTHTVVTSGAGFFNLPIRVGTHNEIVEIIL